VDHLPSRHWALILLLLVLPAAGSACGSDGRSGGAGGKIAFSAPLDGEYRLFIAKADGSGKPTVAPGPRGVGFPVWSPDGSKIAFSDSDSVSTYISSVRADGSHYTRLFDDQNSGTQFVWSGKSDRIAYDWTAIFVVGAAGGGRRLLVHGHFPSWSPDGRMVAFLRGRFVRVINSVGTGERKLARIDGAAEGYVQLLWSSDSRQIAYSTSSWKNPKTSCESGGDCNYVDPDTNTQLCHVHIVSTDRRSHVQVVGGGLLGKFDRQCDIAWSPDGKEVAFTRDGFLYSVTADGTRERRLGARGFAPSWSPDGSHLALLRNETIYVLDVQRGEEHRLARGDELSWSPDGKALVITRTIKEQVQSDQGEYEPGKYVIETTAPDGGHVRRIWPKVGTCDCGEPAWQPH
jgi:Tol biopolymer transport system component